MRDSAEMQAGAATTADPPASRCPVDHRALAAQAEAEAAAAVAHAGTVALDGDHPAGCPVRRPIQGAPPKTAAERFMHMVLFIPAHPERVRERDVQRLFSASILISAVRCLLSYVVFPIVAPTVGALTRTGAFIGIPVGIVALVFDVMAVRRFWVYNHRYKWWFTGIYACVIVMVLALMVRDINHLFG